MRRRLHSGSRIPRRRRFHRHGARELLNNDLNNTTAFESVPSTRVAVVSGRHSDLECARRVRITYCEPGHLLGRPPLRITDNGASASVFWSSSNTLTAESTTVETFDTCQGSMTSGPTGADEKHLLENVVALHDCACGPHGIAPSRTTRALLHVAWGFRWTVATLLELSKDARWPRSNGDPNGCSAAILQPPQ